MTDAKQRNRTICFFIIYLAIMVAVILFKFPFAVTAFGTKRVIELIPFYVAEITNITVFWNNLIYNVLFFIPYGMFICLLKPDWSFIKKTAPISLFSLFLEVMQYILGIGISDITDLILNTAGGMIGIGVYIVMYRLYKEKTHRIINTIALFLLIAALIVMILIL